MNIPSLANLNWSLDMYLLNLSTLAYADATVTYADTAGAYADTTVAYADAAAVYADTTVAYADTAVDNADASVAMLMQQ